MTRPTPCERFVAVAYLLGNKCAAAISGRWYSATTEGRCIGLRRAANRSAMQRPNLAITSAVRQPAKHRSRTRSSFREADKEARLS